MVSDIPPIEDEAGGEGEVACRIKTTAILAFVSNFRQRTVMEVHGKFEAKSCCQTPENQFIN